jgi:hypothetical protein
MPWSTGKELQPKFAKASSHTSRPWCLVASHGHKGRAEGARVFVSAGTKSLKTSLFFFVKNETRERIAPQRPLRHFARHGRPPSHRTPLPRRLASA